LVNMMRSPQAFGEATPDNSNRKGVDVNRSPRPPCGPQNGTQAHDLSRELEFVRPAQVGATPFWDRVEPLRGQEPERKV